MKNTKKTAALDATRNKAKKTKGREEWDGESLIERLLVACSYRRRRERHDRDERERQEKARMDILAANKKAWATEFRLHPLTLVYTTETSGLSPIDNTILRLAWKLYDSHDGWKIVENRDILVGWPEDESRVADGAIETNGLTKEYIEAHGAVSLKEALESFAAAWNRAGRVAAMFPYFHEPFVRKALEECGMEVPYRPHYASGVRRIFSEGNDYTESKIETEAQEMRYLVGSERYSLLDYVCFLRDV